jgi:hypothetical protein
MTLVLSLITSSWAIQVSDRKLVRLDAQGKVTWKNEERNKAVLWCNRLAFGYTGIAEFGPRREPTDEWLSRELAEWSARTDRPAQKQDALVATVIDRATERINKPFFRTIPPRHRRHAFVGIGWARFDRQHEMTPYVVQIHNFPANPKDPAAPARPEFGYALTRLPARPNPVAANWIGQDLGLEEREMLEGLKRGNPSSKAYGDRAAGVMIDIVRSVASSNNLVGRGLMIIVMPKWAIHPGEESTVLLSSGPTAENLTFLHLPHDEDDPIRRGPLHVCEGRQMGNFQAWEPTEEEIAEMLGGEDPPGMS